MNPRDDDEFEPIAPLSAHDDELLATTSKPDIPPRARAGGWQGRTLVVVALLGIAGLGFWSVQLSQQLQQAHLTLEEYQKNLHQLEQRLQVTDESLDQSAIQTEDKLSNLDSEIRKLWDNVWRRSKAQLEAHEVRIEELAAADKDLAEGLKQQAIAISAVDKKIGGVQATVGRLAEQLDTANATNEKVQASIAAVNRKLGELGEGITGASSDKEVMAQRVKELEEWVNSINQYRRQVNQRLNQLETRPPETTGLK